MTGITRESIIRPWGSPMAKTTTRQNRIRMEVCPSRKPRPWKVTVDRKLLLDCQTQGQGIDTARAHAQRLVAKGELVTLKIKRPNGEIRDERTYPRSSDPRGTRG